MDLFVLWLCWKCGNCWHYDYYELENVSLPEALSMTSKNATQVDGLDFFPDGRLAVCFVDGQVYTLKPDTGEWTLFAEGLHTPLGISVVNDQEIVVCQRPEVTQTPRCGFRRYC